MPYHARTRDGARSPRSSRLRRSPAGSPCRSPAVACRSPGSRRGARPAGRPWPRATGACSTSSEPLRCAAPAATSTGPRSSSATWTYPPVVKASPAARALHGRRCGRTRTRTRPPCPRFRARRRPPPRASSRAAEGLDDAAERRAAVQVGGPALQDLDPLDRGPGNAAPVDPAAEGVVQGHAVEEDERAAGPARPHAAKRRALRRGVGDPAARPPEQGEPGHLPQRVVEGQRGARGDVRPAEDDDPLGGVAQPRLGPARGDGHLLASRGPQHQRERLGRRWPTTSLRPRRSRERSPRAGRSPVASNENVPSAEVVTAGPAGGSTVTRAPATGAPLESRTTPRTTTSGSSAPAGSAEARSEHQRAEHRVPQDRLPGVATVALAG